MVDSSSTQVMARAKATIELIDQKNCETIYQAYMGEIDENVGEEEIVNDLYYLVVRSNTNRYDLMDYLLNIYPKQERIIMYNKIAILVNMYTEETKKLANKAIKEYKNKYGEDLDILTAELNYYVNHDLLTNYEKTKETIKKIDQMKASEA